MKVQSALVIGAGIGGLTVAIALQRQGVAVEIYERAPAFAEVGAGIVLWSNAIKALGRLDLMDSVISAGSRLQTSELRDWRGQVLSATPTEALTSRFGAPVVAFHRADLHRVLLGAMPAGAVRLGAACVGYREEAQGVRVLLADGSESAPADLLIGADGVNSAIRAQLRPELKLRASGYGAWRAVVEADAPLGRASESWGRGARFGIVPLASGRVYFFATANHRRQNNRDAAPSDHLAELRRHFSGWHAPIAALVESAANTKILWNDIVDLEPTRGWSRGRVTLLGDAIHPTTPNLGQGAGMAIESAVVLGQCLVEAATLTEAFENYEGRRHERTTWITNQSWQLGRIGQLENGPLRALRDLAVRLTPQQLAIRTLEKAVDFEF